MIEPIADMVDVRCHLGTAVTRIEHRDAPMAVAGQNLTPNGYPTGR
jgi:hypothetical protein